MEMPSWSGWGLVQCHDDMYSVYVPSPLSWIHWRLMPPCGALPSWPL